MPTPGAWQAGDPGHPAEHNRQWQRGAAWLKFNATPTVVTTQQDRYVAAGTWETRADANRGVALEGPTLQVTGEGGPVRVLCTGTLQSGNNVVVGVYLAISRDPEAPLNPGVAGSDPSDRISESEVYITMSGTSRPEAFAIQSLNDVEPGDRVYLIVQNRTGTQDIVVEFAHLTVTAL